jgi:5-methylcytosine-specific restriction endonuclease McrA
MSEPILIDVREVLPGEYRHVWRRALWEAHGRACGVCHQPVGYDEFQVDHIMQRCAGGSDDWSNLRPSHKPCNNGRNRPRRRWERTLTHDERRRQDDAR